MNPPRDPPGVTCPLDSPPAGGGTIQMAHGGGGAATEQLLERVIRPRFRNPHLDAAHDGAVLAPPANRLAFTTDAHVVRPLEFPGGNIGSLAVHGTVNDLAMCGARPRWMSLALILEEGLPIATLERILDAMAAAAGHCGVEVVTGDTKVVDHGHGDGLYLTTAGIGTVESVRPIGPREVREGDAVIVSGDLGRHGVAILSVREGLAFETPVTSDSAPLTEPVLDLLQAGIEVHCLRDLTRGGLAAALHEIAATSGFTIDLDELRVPVDEPVRAACEVLGLDPWHVANEGRFVAFVPAGQADAAVAVLRNHRVSFHATDAGRVVPRGPGPVTVRGPLGAARLLPYLSGEQLPRIC